MGRVKVIDFGISRAIPNPNQLTSELTTFDVQALGAMTPAYASPEMIDGLDPDPRDDVFALACIIYELLTGRHPFGRAPASVARAGNYIPQQPANLSPAQWRALQAGLHFDRAKRAASAEQLLSGLTLQSAVRSQHRWTFAGTALGLLIALGLGAYFAVDGNMIGFEWLRAFEAKDQPRPIANRTCDCFWDVGSDRRPIRRDKRSGRSRRLRRKRRSRLAQQRARGGSGAEVGAAEGCGGSGAAVGAAEGAEEAAQRLAQQRAAEEAAQRLAQQRAADEAAQRLAQQRAAEEAAQRLAQQRAAEEAATRGRRSSRPPQLPPDQIGPSQIAEAQRLLTSMGLNTGVANGKMGPRTQEMVRAFQLSMGLPSTGELTTALLETLRGTTPPAAARAKSLFTLAAEARNARRLGDATRLYEAALKLAPNDADGLLALGDLRRDANDLDAARRAYETLASGRGAAAGIARERLAGLPNQQQPSNAQTDARRCIPGCSLPVRRTAGQPLRRSISADQHRRERDRPDATRLIRQGRSMAPIPDVRQLTGFSNPTCRPTLSTAITVRDGKLSFLTRYYDDRSARRILQRIRCGRRHLPPITQHLTGRIQNGTIEADATDQNCNYHMSLKKSG